MVLAPYYVRDGELIHNTAPSVSVTDIGLLRGFACFDYLRTYNGRPFRLRSYVDRFFSSADGLGISIPGYRECFENAVVNALSTNQQTTDVSDYGIRFLVTGGQSLDGYYPADAPTWLVLFEPPPKYSLEDTQNGIKVLTDEYLRDTPALKTTNYANVLRQQRRLQEAGAKELLYVWQGGVLEASRSNVFAFFGEKLVTPNENILFGNTRATVIELAAEMFDIDERHLSLSELLHADEVFLTGSGRRVTPVVQIDDKRFHSTGPMSKTSSIIRAFDEFAFSMTP